MWHNKAEETVRNKLAAEAAHEAKAGRRVCEETSTEQHDLILTWTVLTGQLGERVVI
jgi:hypothetical protein